MDAHEAAERFPTEESAVQWFESVYWPEQRSCGHCGSIRTKDVPDRNPMPFFCNDCRSYFSVRTGTVLQYSRLPLRKWAMAVYLYVTCRNDITSVKLHRDLRITQKSASLMLHRLREAWKECGIDNISESVNAKRN